MNKLKAMYKKENGSVLLLAALAFMGLLTMAGLIIDGGMLYMTKAHLQKTANAAVLSGAQELTNSETAVRSVVDQILVSHEETSSLKQLDIVIKNRVAIDLEKPVSLAFSKLFGMETANVYAHAAVELGVMARARGAAPLGVEQSAAMQFYQPVQLKVGAGDSTVGNFGILALQGTGAKTYEETLRNGYQEELKVGRIVPTQTGNIAEPTRRVVKEKIDACYQNPVNFFARNCSRILLVPIYKPTKVESNQVKEVIITGFAYFYIKDPMSDKDESITGYFIERTGKGFSESGAVNGGAYTIRLTE